MRAGLAHRARALVAALAVLTFTGLVGASPVGAGPTVPNGGVGVPGDDPPIIPNSGWVFSGATRLIGESGFGSLAAEGVVAS